MSDQLLSQIKVSEDQVRDLTSKKATLEGRRQSLEQQYNQTLTELMASTGKSSLAEIQQFLAEERKRIETQVASIRESLVNIQQALTTP
jgi:flagellar capping protein FliD